MTIYLASNNRHKKEEIAPLLSPHRLLLPEEEGIEFRCEEKGATFLENALAKAQALHDLVSAPVLADDSGLVVEALGGAPGVRSARFGEEAGRSLSAEEKNALLLGMLDDESDRRAAFVCCMVLLLSPQRFYIVQETLEGTIARESRGTHGFGYDPIFLLPDGRHLAEVSLEEKNRISHRGKAARKLRLLMEDLT
ncbi:Nucleoside-triphosphatase rdgB [Spirochaeta thermophila DSM 6578]|uniref:dITP/XTP pyrophosphatase n=1 Tax=Winmispira thermophila (strain ATCC 700085 / DSM 6578 / Z-1203) TaxID=869211 RepID=G0GD81_WINT7|nr:RdgB/HAM1 family non-canonical purine NTP pyrophosphatase [Spirochaeta thermophila]AEJ62156.1 Nucleoside-triphosphatase rdgB [Spirochaeta thermophila DSM 6578]